MNKDTFNERLTKFEKEQGERPLKVRLNLDRNYGLDIQTYSLWLVGRSSCDESLTMGVDTLFLERFKSNKKACDCLFRYQKWLMKYHQESENV